MAKALQATWAVTGMAGTCRTDDKWHHIAVTWKWDTGETHLYFDGHSQTPFWRAEGEDVSAGDPSKGGVDNKIAAQSSRHDQGELSGLVQLVNHAAFLSGCSHSFGRTVSSSLQVHIAGVKSLNL